MKGMARTLIALLVAGALFVAMAIPALAATLTAPSGNLANPVAPVTAPVDDNATVADGADGVSVSP